MKKIQQLETKSQNVKSKKKMQLKRLVHCQCMFVSKQLNQYLFIMIFSCNINEVLFVKIFLLLFLLDLVYLFNKTTVFVYAFTSYTPIMPLPAMHL